MSILTDENTGPQLLPEQKKLEVFLGNWTGEEVLAPTPWEPEGGTGIGRAQNSLALHGNVVIQNYELDRAHGVDMRGHGVILWNKDIGQYQFYWFDSSGMPPTVFNGNFDGDVITFVSESEHGNMRAAFDFSERDTYLFRLDHTTTEGGDWQNLMKGKYKKQGP